MAIVKFIETQDSKLASIPIKQGQFIWCYDSGDCFRDTQKTRVKIGVDIIVLKDEEDLPLAPIKDKIYVYKHKDLYIWDNKISDYKIIQNLELGEKSTNAGRGDWTKEAYEHSKSEHAPTTAQENIIEKITLGSVQQTIVNKTIALPKYPTTLPASDVSAWAKSSTKPTYTKNEIGLGNVPNVTTNDQTPTFTLSSTLANIITGEKLTIMLGKIAKTIADFIAHKADNIIHTSETEKANWNDANTKKHTHSNKAVLDKLTQALLDKLGGIADGANKYVHPTDDGNKHVPATGTTNNGKLLQSGATAGSMSWVSPTKSMVGLGSVDNTADADKRVSYAASAGNTRYLSTNYIDANVDLNSITTPGIYCCILDSTAAGLKNCPTTRAFLLMVGRHAGVYQRVTEYVTKNPRTFERNYYSGTWGAWRDITVLTSVPAEAKFTDTVYVHPNSGAVAGTYRSVTVNAQGHVTAGSNPTTLAGYGITDAATKSHTHTKSQISDFPTAVKNPAALTISLNSSSQGAYDGSSAKSINITAANIGAVSTSDYNVLKQDVEILKERNIDGGNAFSE